mmetsp:Transcript_115908/g.322736  ORF Transcript_115908/g.322736 Transcript_115908/m.322736 type:complete len:253 (+) Transcript_115908:152-910(+)
MAVRAANSHLIVALTLNQGKQAVVFDVPMDGAHFAGPLPCAYMPRIHCREAIAPACQACWNSNGARPPLPSAAGSLVGPLPAPPPAATAVAPAPLPAAPPASEMAAPPAMPASAAAPLRAALGSAPRLAPCPGAVAPAPGLADAAPRRPAAPLPLRRGLAKALAVPATVLAVPAPVSAAVPAALPGAIFAGAVLAVVPLAVLALVLAVASWALVCSAITAFSCGLVSRHELGGQHRRTIGSLGYQLRSPMSG